MKKPVLVRFANESYHNTIVEMDITKLQDVIKFPNEVFGTIDGVRIAILREEYEQMLKSYEQN